MTAAARERLGLLGGTFDPVHTAHVVMAVEARATLSLDRVLFVVAGDPWQKRGSVVAPAADRLALVAAAVAEVEGLEASGLEIDSGEPAVTADTLERVRAPGRELFLLLGADAVAGLATWRRLDTVRELATLAVVGRAGSAPAAPPGAGWRCVPVEIPALEISSTDVRARCASGRPIDGLVPPAVVREIRRRRLYTPA